MAHISAQELRKLLAQARQLVQVGCKYYHYKNPTQLYTLTDLIIIEENDTVGVLYRAEYERLLGITFMRPLIDFLAIVTVDGKEQPRFSKVR